MCQKQIISIEGVPKVPGHPLFFFSKTTQFYLAMSDIFRIFAIGNQQGKQWQR
jgi:hypothetical protein